MKTCSKCKEQKPLDAFFNDRHSADGKRTIYKPCINARSRAYYRNNLEKFKEYRKVNADKIKERRFAYRDQNKIYNDNLDPATKLFRGVRSRAKACGIEFSITIEDITIPSHCPVCAKELSPNVSGRMKGPLLSSPSVDRIHNDYGYIPGNIAVICFGCNTMKSNNTTDTLLALLYYIQTHSQQLNT